MPWSAQGPKAPQLNVSAPSGVSFESRRVPCLGKHPGPTRSPEQPRSSTFVESDTLKMTAHSASPLWRIPRILKNLGTALAILMRVLG